MYPDPKRVRQHRIVVRLDQYELDVLASIANYQGEAIATMARNLIMREAATVLSSDNTGSVTQHAG